MAPNDDTKMDELKRLLRRLDGLDDAKSPGKAIETATQEQRDYVGALRGVPDIDPAASTKLKAPPRKLSTGSIAFVAAAVAALVSSFAVYVVMTADRPAASLNQRQDPASGSIVPSRLDASPAQKGSEVNGTLPPADIKSELVRRAARLREVGDVPAARELLKQAADLGSGIAALELAKSYEAALAATSADDQSNAAAARAWYERARALGVNETASEASASRAP